MAMCFFYLCNYKSGRENTYCVYLLRVEETEEEEKQAKILGAYDLQESSNKCRTACVISGRIRRRDTISLASWDGSP